MNINSIETSDWGVRRHDNVPADTASTAGKNKIRGYGGSQAADVQFDREALKNFIGAMEKFSHTLGVSLKLHFDERSNMIQAEVRDSSGEKVLRRLPPDEIIDLAVSIRKLSGLLAERSL